MYRCVVSGVPPWDVLEAECFIGPVSWPGTNGGVFAAVPNEEAAKSKKNKRSLTTFTGSSTCFWIGFSSHERCSC